MSDLDRLDRLFIGWAFLFQLAHIAHFAVRRRLFESYTLEFGWLVYALCLPAAVVAVVLLRGGKSWPFWLGGLLCVLYAGFGYWVDYLAAVPWRSPLHPAIMVPYLSLYLGTVMFYWWPLGLLARPLWFAFAVLFVVGTFLNVTSH